MRTVSSLTALSLTLEEQDPGANQEAQTIDVSSVYNNDLSGFEDVFTVVFDEENNDYYVFLDTDELNEDLGNAGSFDQIADGDEYQVEFTVQNARLLENLEAVSDSDEDAYEDAFESVNATTSFETAEGEFDADPVEVGAAAEQTVTGTTNVAPGSELGVRVRSDSA